MKQKIIYAFPLEEYLIWFVRKTHTWKKKNMYKYIYAYIHSWPHFQIWIYYIMYDFF